jgi:hypothetical protein
VSHGAEEGVTVRHHDANGDVIYFELKVEPKSTANGVETLGV